MNKEEFIKKMNELEAQRILLKNREFVLKLKYKILSENETY